MSSINPVLMMCYSDDNLLLPQYEERSGFKVKGENNFLQSQEKFSWTSIDSWKNDSVVNFTYDYIELMTNNYNDSKRIKLYFGLLETPNDQTGDGKFWVSTDPNPKNRCIVNFRYINFKSVCHFYPVDVIFGNELHGQSWPSIKIYSSIKKIMFEFDKEIDNIDIDMLMCMDYDCLRVKSLRYDDTDLVADSNSQSVFRRTKEIYSWASTVNSTIQMTTKIGSEQMRNKVRSIPVHLTISKGEYIIIVSDSCTLHQNNFNSSCQIDDLYIRFGDQGSIDNFPSIEISYGGKFFYSKSLC